MLCHRSPVDRLYNLLTGGSFSAQCPGDDIDRLLAAARNNRVERQLISVVLDTPDMEGSSYQVLRDSLSHSDYWFSFLRKFTEEFFAALRAAGCDAVLIKGFVLQTYYHRAFGEAFRRDQTDVDCAVKSFEDFLLLADVASALGLTLKGLAIRKGRLGIAGAAEFFLPVHDSMHDALSVECQFGGQPLSLFSMREYGDALWREAVQPDTSSALRMAGLEECLDILAGEVFENGTIRLRDYLDYTALMQADGALLRRFSPYVHWLHRRMIVYARKNALPLPGPLSKPTGEGDRSKIVPNEFESRPGQWLFNTVRRLVRRFRADRLGAFLASRYRPSTLWERGWYIEAIQINNLPCPPNEKETQPDGSLLRTPIGEFLLVPFGIVTLADVRGLVGRAQT